MLIYLTQMPIVHPQCFNKEGHCFHWIQETVESRPELCPGRDIDDFTPCIVSNEPRISRKYKNEIAHTEPSVSKPPTNGDRPVTSITIFNDESKVNDAIHDAITSDCWSVYLRDSKTHKLEKIFFFTNNEDDNENQELEETKRDFLIENKNVLLSSLTATNQLCMSFGCSPFIDSYYQRVGDQIIRVDVDLSNIFED